LGSSTEGKSIRSLEPNQMIKIVYDSPGFVVPDGYKVLEYPEYKKLPSAFVPEVKEYILNREHSIVIYTAHEAIANAIGQMIADNQLSFISPTVYFNDEEYLYDRDGCLTHWPFGCLSHWD